MRVVLICVPEQLAELGFVGFANSIYDIHAMIGEDRENAPPVVRAGIPEGQTFGFQASHEPGRRALVQLDPLCKFVDTQLPV